jgi:hypothetical protein
VIATRNPALTERFASSRPIIRRFGQRDFRKYIKASLARIARILPQSLDKQPAN